MRTFFEDAQDESLTMNYNGKDIPLAYWNLVMTKRDLSLWCKLGMKPNRHWKVTDVKKYFDIKGTRETLYNNFIEKYGRFLGEQS